MSSSKRELRISSEGSANEDVLFSSSEGKSRSIGEESARDPRDISSNDERIGKRVIGLVVGSLKESSDRITRSKSNVVSSSQSSLDISGVGDEISERNDVEVSERIDSASKRNVQTSAISLESRAKISVVGRMRSRSRGLAVNSVDLKRHRDGINDDNSFDETSSLIQNVVGSQDRSNDGSIGNVDGSSRSNDVEQSLLGSMIDVVSSKVNIVHSDDVEDDLTGGVAARSVVRSDGVEVSVGDRDRV